MDDLTYSYNGNQLKAVDDDIAASATQGFVDGAELATEYTYDGNGNMVSDANKGITSIAYNHLNLPVQVNFGSGNIKYDYAADGTKLKRTVSTTGTETLYANGFLYEGNTLQFFRHAEGYVSAENGNFEYVYEFKDHLGNIRLSYTDADGNGSIDPANEIISEKNYYPFGMTHSGYNNVVSANANSQAEKLQYNGKELNEELGLNWLDYGWRNYQPDLGRWMNIDNLAGMMKSQSPYSYAFNNPIYYIDIDGLMPGSGPERFTDYYYGPDGKVYFDPNVNGPDDVCADCQYIGPTYYDEASRTVWGPDGKPMRLNAIALDEVVVTAQRIEKGCDKCPPVWGSGTEDLGNSKGTRKGDFDTTEMPGFGTAKGGGNPWSRFINWLNGVFNRGTTLQDVNAANSPPGTSTMEQQPEPEPSVQYPYSFFLITFEDGKKTDVFSTSHTSTSANDQQGAIKRADSLLSADSNRDSVRVSPHFTRARGANEIRTVRDTTIKRN